MRTFIQSMVGLGLIAMLSTPALAQGRGFGGRGGGSLGGLLGNESVQKELKLDDSQVEKAKEVAEKTREKMTEMRETLQGLDQEERRTKQAELTKELNESTLKTIGAFLKAEQVARLKQISYQQRGLQAFSDPEIAKKLNLTDSQKTDIQAISQETMESSRGLISQDSTPEERAEGMKKIAEIRKAALTKVETKLNDEQQKTWKELLGAPFEIKFEPRPN
jgi:hypothetical protein